MARRPRRLRHRDPAVRNRYEPVGRLTPRDPTRFGWGLLDPLNCMTLLSCRTPTCNALRIICIREVAVRIHIVCKNYARCLPWNHGRFLRDEAIAGAAFIGIQSNDIKSRIVFAMWSFCCRNGAGAIAARNSAERAECADGIVGSNEYVLWRQPQHV